MDISSILTEARCADKVKRTKAEKMLSENAETNFPQFLLLLAYEISNEEKIKENRQLAASIIKNSIVYHDNLQNQWLKMNNEQISQIKTIILASLASNFKEVRKAVGLIIAGICKIELPKGKWPDIIQILVNTAMNVDKNVSLASLETLGYICEEINIKKGLKQDEIDQILTVLVRCLSKEAKDFTLGYNVMNTLLSTIPLAEKNFKNKKESEIIFNLIFECINGFKSHPSFEELLYIIIQILIEIMTKYYDIIEKEIFIKIADFSMQVFSSFSLEKLLVLNFEFWLTIAEYELDISETIEYKGYIENLSTELIKHIDIYLKRSYEEDEDDEVEWTISKAALLLLSYIAQFANKELFENMMNYVKQSLLSNDWKLKNEALLIFGCLLESNFKHEIIFIIKGSLSGLLTLLFDGNYIVRKSCAWLFVKITELHPKIFEKNILDTFIPVLINALSDKNSISIKICNCIINLSKELGDKDTIRNTNSMSSYFETLFKELYYVAYKEGSYDKDQNLSMSAFLTISFLIEYSSHDKQDKLEEMLLFFTNSFEKALSSNNTKENDKFLDFQTYIVNIIGSIFEKSLKCIKHEIVINLYTLIENSFKQRNGVFDEAISAISSVAKNQGEKFDVIMDRFLPYLKYSLSRHNETILLQFSVIAIGDISKAIKAEFGKYINAIVPDMFSILQEKNINEKTKVLAIEILGDMAMNIPQQFQNYLDDLMSVLMSACDLALIIDDEDEEDEENYFENLRTSLVEAFTSVAFGMKECKREKEFAQYVPSIFKFLKEICQEDYDPPNKLLKSVIGFVADMCTTYGKEMKVLIQDNTFIFEILNKLKSSKSKKNADLINWANEAITLILSS